MKLSASIVVYNSPSDEVERAIECLLHSSVTIIYIIENSREQNLIELTKRYKEVIYRHVENRGYGAGHNVALRDIIIDSKSDSDYHIVMNADVWWEGNAIEPLAEYLETHKDVGMAMPKVVYPDGVLQYTCRMLPTPVDLIFKRFIPERIIKKRLNRYLLAHHNHDYPLNCPYLLGSFLMIRVSALKEIGLFDERFFMYPEDIDITRRIHIHYQTLYLPISTIVHAHAASSRSDIKMLYIHIKNMIKYFNKWGWWFDRKRRLLNSRLLKAVVFQPQQSRPQGRG